MAVLGGIETAVRLHIRRGDDLDARDGNGMTPLMLAASKNKGGICSILISSGADASLLDPSGRDALMIATAVKASLAVLAIQAFTPKKEEIRSASDEPVLEAKTGAKLNSRLEADEDSLTVLPRQYTEALNGEKCLSDLSGWEAEEDGPAPEEYEDLAEAAVLIHRAISSHMPIDSFEGWADFEAFLPERATLLPSTGDEERRKEIRKLLFRALREGSVPERDIENIGANEDGSFNKEREALVRLVLGDLGSETDERMETEIPNVGVGESESEYEAVSEALTFLDDLGSGANEPLRFYYKDMRGKTLLSAEEEISLGRTMEVGKESALDALAAWPDGVATVLAAADRVRTGEADVEAISAGGSGELAEEEGNGFQTATEVIEEGDEPEGLIVLSFAAREFLERAATIRNLAHHAGTGAGEKNLRDALALARLTTPFLSQLALSAENDSGGPGSCLRRAIALYSQARDHMVTSNLRLVISFVKRYQGFGLTLDDLVQEGNIGLIKAVDRYNWRKGFRFSTYATWWIRQQVWRAVADLGRMIRTPVHVHDTMLRISREADEMERWSGRRPSTHALAECLSLPAKGVAALLARSEEPVSLHEPDNAGSALSDDLIDQAASDPYTAAERTSLIEALAAVLADLDQRSAEVIKIRFGLDGRDSRTLEETGAFFGLTRERIRQIEAKALRKLAHPSRAEILYVYLDHPPRAKAEKAVEEKGNETVEENETGGELEPRGKSLKRSGKEVDGIIPDSVNRVVAIARGIDTHREAGRRTGGEV